MTDIKGAKAATMNGAIKVPVSKDPDGVITWILH